MYYYTYEIYIDDETSSLNGSYYYGKHETNNLDDNYYGSGRIIKRYIKKNGVNKLKKTILCFYNNRIDLNNAEYELVKNKKQFLKEKCINLRDGGNGGHWVEYCTEEEYKRRSELVKIGLMLHTSAEQRHLAACKASEAKRNAPIERKLQWKYKDAFNNMTEEKKIEKYSKVSSSLKEYYKNLDPKIREEKRIKNINSNKESSKKWRTEFYNIFKRTPESFRKYNKLKEAIDLFKRIKNLNKKDIENEVKRFVESINS